MFDQSELVVLKSALEAKANADADRRAECERRMDMLEDDWAGQLRNFIFESFESENAKELWKVSDTTNNPAKRIIDEISMLYREPPTWDFAEGVDGELWQDILARANANAVLPELNRVTNACNESVAVVQPDARRTKLKIHVVSPADVIAGQDPRDPTEPLWIAWRESMVDSPKQMPFWRFWSAGEHPITALLNDKFEEIKGTREPNPYTDENGMPVLPATIYHSRYPMGRLWRRTQGKDIFDATLLIALLETWINHLVRTDSHRQKYASGQMQPSGSYRGGTLDVLLFQSSDGNPLTIGEFSSQSDWAGLGGIVARKLENVLNNNGLSMSDFRVEGSPQSGFALRVRKEGLIELRERQIPVFTQNDQGLYATVAAVWNFERDNAMSSMFSNEALPWPSEAEPTPTYAPFQTTLTVQERREQLDLDRQRIRLGLETPVSIFQREHPGISEEEARDRVTRNLVDTRQLGFEELVPSVEINRENAQGLLASALADRLARRSEQEDQQGGEDET